MLQDCERTIQNLLPHLPDIIVYPRPIGEIHAGGLKFFVGVRDRRVWQAVRLGYDIDNIHAKSVTASVEPEAHHVPDSVSDSRIVPVQVRLFLNV